MKKTTAAVASCLLFGMASITLADPIALKINLSPGQSWTFDSNQNTDSDNHAVFNGQTQPFKSSAAAHRAGKMEVLAVKDGLPTSMKITFTADSKSSQSMNGQAQDVPFPYAGKTVTITRQADGTITDDFQGPVLPEAASELHTILDQNAAIFPSKPVDIGQDWPGDTAAVARLLELNGPDDRGGMTMKLIAVHPDSPSPTADVKVSMAVMKNQNGLMIKIISQGAATVELNTGHLLKLDMQGTTDVSGTQTGPGLDGTPTQYQIDGSGKLTIAQTGSPLAGNAMPIAAGNPPMGNAGTNPLGSGVNPLAAPTASPFAGHFTDGKLTVDLTGPNDRLSGTLALGGQVYPATANSKDARGMTGSFVAGGSAYPFTATVEGDTMVLMSAGTTYTLKKASLNPLAAPR